MKAFKQPYLAPFSPGYQRMSEALWFQQLPKRAVNSYEQ